jgi:Fe-S-cluster containining protein
VKKPHEIRYPRNPDELRGPAAEKRTENRAFREWLKSATIPGPTLDKLVRKFFRESPVDCRDCGECCRALYISLTDAEARRFARIDKMPFEEFASKFLVRVDEEKPWLFKERACIFQHGNLCTIYEKRGSDCRSYPHIHKPGFRDRLHGVIESTQVCPIVFEVIERLKEETGYTKELKAKS